MLIEICWLKLSAAKLHQFIISVFVTSNVEFLICFLFADFTSEKVFDINDVFPVLQPTQNK